MVWRLQAILWATSASFVQRLNFLQTPKVWTLWIFPLETKSTLFVKTTFLLLAQHRGSEHLSLLFRFGLNWNCHEQFSWDVDLHCSPGVGVFFIQTHRNNAILSLQNSGNNIFFLSCPSGWMGASLQSNPDLLTKSHQSVWAEDINWSEWFHNQCPWTIPPFVPPAVRLDVYMSDMTGGCDLITLAIYPQSSWSPAFLSLYSQIVQWGIRLS